MKQLCAFLLVASTVGFLSIVVAEECESKEACSMYCMIQRLAKGQCVKDNNGREKCSCIGKRSLAEGAELERSFWCRKEGIRYVCGWAEDEVARSSFDSKAPLTDGSELERFWCRYGVCGWADDEVSRSCKAEGCKSRRSQPESQELARGRCSIVAGKMVCPIEENVENDEVARACFMIKGQIVCKTRRSLSENAEKGFDDSEKVQPESQELARGRCSIIAGKMVCPIEENVENDEVARGCMKVQGNIVCLPALRGRRSLSENAEVEKSFEDFEKFLTVPEGEEARKTSDGLPNPPRIHAERKPTPSPKPSSG